MPLDPAVAALAGTAIGGASAWLVERARWKRQLDIRWDETRLARYVELFTLMDEHCDIFEYKRLDDTFCSSSDPDKVQRSGKDWKESCQRASRVKARLNEIEILSSSEVSEAAYRCWYALAHYIQDPRADDTSARHKSYEAAKDKLVEATRRELVRPTRTLP